MSVWNEAKSTLLGWRLIAVLLVLLLAPWAMAALVPANQVVNSSPASSGTLGVTIQWQQWQSPAPAKEPVSTLLPKKAPSKKETITQSHQNTARQVSENNTNKTAAKTPLADSAENKNFGETKTDLAAESVLLDQSHSAVQPLGPEQNEPSQSHLRQSSASLGAHDVIEISEPLFAEPPTPPHYPGKARRRGQQGTVWLDIWLDKQGQHQRIEIAKSSGIDSLDRSALDAVSQWRFLPYQEASIAMASRVRVPVKFQLQD